MYKIHIYKYHMNIYICLYIAKIHKLIMRINNPEITKCINLLVDKIEFCFQWLRRILS